MGDVTHDAWPLPVWLEYIERQHPVAWDLGLARVGAVADLMNLRVPAPLVAILEMNHGMADGSRSYSSDIERTIIMQATNWSIWYPKNPTLYRCTCSVPSIAPALADFGQNGNDLQSQTQ